MVRGVLEGSAVLVELLRLVLEVLNVLEVFEDGLSVAVGSSLEVQLASARTAMRRIESFFILLSFRRCFAKF